MCLALFRLGGTVSRNRQGMTTSGLAAGEGKRNTFTWRHNRLTSLTETDNQPFQAVEPKTIRVSMMSENVGRKVAEPLKLLKLIRMPHAKQLSDIYEISAYPD